MMNEVRSPKKVTDELKEALSQKKADVSQVMRLASELATLDSTSGHFSVNATIIRRLGRELVANRETALAELVKNCYDANANTVEVIISRLGSLEARLVIKDDGDGMTPDQLRRGFLTIASDEKEREPESPRLHRKRAGQKGIGRFAVERLGRKLTLVTATETATEATELTVDWDIFEKSGDLFLVRNPIKNSPKPFKKGTHIIIDQLREPWSIDGLTEAQSYIFDLLEPTYFDPVGKSVRDESENENRFKVSFNVLDGVRPAPIEPREREYVEAAVAIIDATVDAQGAWKIRVKSKLFKEEWEYELSHLSDDEKKGWIFPQLRSVRLRAAYFIWDSDVATSLGYAKKGRDIRARSGIKLYRNGFRVPPYGSPGDDWLALDAEEAKRVLLVPLGNRNWLGFISIDDPAHEFAIETSSREGLVQNDFYRQLKEFLRKALRYCSSAVGQKRGRKVYASQTDFGQSKADRAQKTVQRLAKEINDLTRSRASSQNSFAKDAITDSTIAEVRSELEKLLKDTTELSSEVGILRTMASVGMSVLMFSHEVKGMLVAILSRIELLALDKTIKGETREHLKQLKQHIEVLQHHTGYYESTGSAAASRKRVLTDMLSCAHTFAQTFAYASNSHGIELVFEGDLLLPRRYAAIHEAEFTAVLINLYTNSVKAIIRKKGTAPKIVLRHSRVESRDILEVLDTGDGIPAKDKERVFEPFYTTAPIRTALRPGDPEIFGTGLGLTITRDSIKSGNGAIAVVVPPPKPFSTCIRIEMPHVPYEE